MKKHEKRKETLKKAGYFAAGVTATVGTLYLTKKICENTIKPNVTVGIKAYNEEKIIALSESIPKIPSIFKGLFTDREVCFTPANAKIIGTTITICAEELLKKE